MSVQIVKGCGSYFRQEWGVGPPSDAAGCWVRVGYVFRRAAAVFGCSGAVRFQTGWGADTSFQARGVGGAGSVSLASASHSFSNARGGRSTFGCSGAVRHGRRSIPLRREYTSRGVTPRLVDLLANPSQTWNNQNH